MVRIRISGVIDGEVAAKVYAYHEARLAQAKREGVYVVKAHNARFHGAKGGRDEWSFSQTLEEVIKVGLSETRAIPSPSRMLVAASSSSKEL